MTYSVEEVRSIVAMLGANMQIGAIKMFVQARNMLTDYADLLEQIERAKDGVTGILDVAMDAWASYWGDCNDANVAGNNRGALEAAFEAVAHLLPRGKVHCPCGLPTCVEPWEPGCGLGRSPEHVGIAEEGSWSAPTADPRVQIDICTELNCPRCRTHPDHRGDMEHAGIGSRPTADPVTQGEGDFISNDDAEALATWLDKKYKRHGEIEDQQAANLLRLLAAQPRVPDGWVLVPREATQEMADAWSRGGKCMSNGLFNCFAYRDMLAAAPQPKEAKS